MGTPGAPQDPSSLIDRARRGDGSAVGALIERYRPELEGYVRRRAGAIVGARESVSDVVQSAFREVIESLERFRFDGEEGFKKWLFVTTLRKIRDRHRYYAAEKRGGPRARRVAAGGSSFAGASRAFFQTFATPSGEAVFREELARIERIFEALPERYRRVLTLAQIERVPGPEVARRMGLSEGNARVLLSRALARLATLACVKP